MTKQNLQALEKLEKEFTQLHKNLIKKIETLEQEKAALLEEIESLKEKGEAKARNLEKEVITLRKEVKALETIFNIKGKHEITKPENKNSS